MLDEKTQGLITCIYLIRIQDHAIYCNISCCRVPPKQMNIFTASHGIVCLVISSLQLLQHGQGMRSVLKAGRMS